jgi:hypothetical protein
MPIADCRFVDERRRGAHGRAPTRGCPRHRTILSKRKQAISTAPLHWGRCDCTVQRAEVRNGELARAAMRAAPS